MLAVLVLSGVYTVYAITEPNWASLFNLVDFIYLFIYNLSYLNMINLQLYLNLEQKKKEDSGH